MTLRKPTQDPTYLRLAPYFEMDESGKNGKEKSRGGKTSEKRGCERSTVKHKNTEVNRNQSNQFFINKSCLLLFANLLL